ncbi:hypothetical protein [Roseicyclus mahoneyensis]|jgi:hypothetical protein|uniref:Uncharacterized protein n=1 Tax=Roseicyclus mahoneyensis TaxID=164332 RepID=A0A316GJQ7_9RHOB|nr:hypothetical protein [Roseicyclus mahoneyensis]PWK60497.1 hypothetical protein C7455_104133 [Roseicyclus mahoneyensis]
MRRAAPLVALMLLASPGQAQDDAFTRQMDAALAPAGDSAPFLRCTGFFQAFRVLAGVESEPGAAALERELDLAVMSTLLRQQETGAEETAVMDEIRPLIEAASALYVDRIVANEAATGMVMDDGLMDTLEACSELRLQFLDAMESLSE